METLAPDDFQQESYFEAYVRYIENRRQACIKGKNSNVVDFILPWLEGDDLSNGEDTMPLNGEVTFHDGDDDEAAT